MRKVFCSFLILSYLSAGLLPAAALPAQTGQEAKLRFAAAQHEIIAILIKEEQFDRVLPAFQQILELGFTGAEEQLVVKEVWSVVNSLTAVRQYATAHAVLDEALAFVAQQDNRFALLMLQGKVFKQEGRLREALSSYREAQELQER